MTAVAAWSQSQYSARRLRNRADSGSNRGEPSQGVLDGHTIEEGGDGVVLTFAQDKVVDEVTGIVRGDSRTFHGTLPCYLRSFCIVDYLVSGRLSKRFS